MYTLLVYWSWVKKYYPCLLIFFTFPIAELHTYWFRDRTVQNWIWQNPTPMLIQWNVKYASDQLVWIIIAFASWQISKNPDRIKSKCLLVFFTWCILDTIVYFVNFKVYGYEGVYLWLTGIWVLLSYGRAITNYLWKTLHGNE